MVITTFAQIVSIKSECFLLMNFMERLMLWHMSKWESCQLRKEVLKEVGPYNHWNDVFQKSYT